MGFQNESPVQYMTGKTIDEIKTKLFQMFGPDYRILEKQIIETKKLGGLLGKHQMIKVSFQEIKRNSTATNGFNALSGSYVNPDRQPLNQPETENFNQNKLDLLKKLDSGTNLTAISLAKLTDQLNDISSKVDSLASAGTSSSDDEIPVIAQIEELLQRNDFSFSYIKSIIAKIKKTFSLEELNDFKLVQKQVVDWIGESISLYEPPVKRKPQVYILVGPTGVGKTTTLVKLATKYFMAEQKLRGHAPEIRFITTDSMKVGAEYQLKKFSQYFNQSVIKAESAEDIKQIYSELKDYVDAMFIDTSGYSPNDAQHIATMKSMLSVSGLDPEIFLCMSASTKSRDLNNIMQNYEIFGYNSVIITKCDESGQFGNVISVLNERHKKTSYITFGQNAAKCISKSNIVDFLIRLEGFEIDRDHINEIFGEQ